MEFKIDTKPTFVQITPVTNHLNENLTGALSQKCIELAETGSENFVIDLRNCLNADNMGITALANIHERCYNNNQSIVFTGINTFISAALKDAELDMILNIAPTENEAVDIISMEILERDLLGEED